MNIEAAKAVLDEMEGVSGDMYDGSLTMHEDIFHDYARRIRDALEEEPRRGAGTRTPKAAIREALENFTRYEESDIRQLEHVAKKMIDRCEYGGGIIQAIAGSIREAKSALVEPMRNCDRFGGDYKKLNTAWFDWTGSPSGQNPDGTVKLTFGEWLLAPADESEVAK